MSHIAASSNNSFIIDNDGFLYSWGSKESGLLGYEADKDVTLPNKIEATYGHSKYFAHKIYAGPFHVALIGDRKNLIQRKLPELQKELEFAQQYFKDLLEWYNQSIRVYSPVQLISLLVKNPQNQEMKYADFEKYFLLPFFEYLKLNKKDFFHMKKTYEELLRDTLQFTKNKPSFKVADLERLAKDKNPKIRDIYNYADECYQHLYENPEDFHYFTRIVFKYKAFIGFEEIDLLLKYCPKYSEGIDQNILYKIISVLKVKEGTGEFSGIFIEANIFSDLIIGKDTGEKSLLTWGVNAKGRLGYREVDKIASTADGEGELVQLKPKLVYFKKHVKIKEVACGLYHTLALTEDRRVFSWGTSKYGCLGKYIKHDQTSPMEIELDYDKNNFSGIIQIGAGQFFSIALNDKGKVFTWGLGNKGRLGHGNENSVETPKRVDYFEEENIFIEQISCGDLHCGAITRNKELYTWGNGAFGKLGHCNYDNVLKPKYVSYFSNQKIRVAYCGSYNTMVITTDSRLFVFGKNCHGMLGVPQFADQNVLYPTELLYQKDDESLAAAEVALGTMHSLVLCQDGTALSCGNSVNGVLGLENVYDKIEFPGKIGNDFFKTEAKDFMKESALFKGVKDDFTLDDKSTGKFATSILYTDCSAFNSAFITNSGELYMTGDKKLIPKELNEDGTPVEGNDDEDEDESTRDLVTRCRFFTDKVSYVALGKYHAVCIADGKAYSWGKNVSGVCGISGKALDDVLPIPTIIDAIKSPSKMICVSDSHTMILTTNGEIYSCGSNSYGKLGVSDLKKYFSIGVAPLELEPTLVKNVSDVRFIACSNYHSGCISKVKFENRELQSVFTWGNGLDGKLGHGSIFDYYEPKKIEEYLAESEDFEPFNIVKIALGDDFSLALDEKGRLFGWGKRKYLPGLRDDLEGKEEKPILLLKKNIFKNISAKYNFASAISFNGDLYCWGDTVTESGVKNLSFGLVGSDKAQLSSIGFNHCTMIDENYFPFAWGNNIFNKCGHEAAGDVKEELSDNPKRIEWFFIQLNNNKENQKHEEAKDLQFKDKSKEQEGDNQDAEANKKLEEARKEGRDLTQLRLMDESEESKNLGLMIQDLKVNDSFFETIKKFFISLKEVELKRSKLIVNTADMVISDINKTGLHLKNVYKSEIPLVYSKNFQYFETFLQLLQCHPCYFRHLYKVNSNVPSLMKIIHLIYGPNYIALRNKRVIAGLTGIWNGLFQMTEIIPGYDLSSSILFAIYELLFMISEENINLANELISVAFVVLLTKIIEKENINLERDAERIILKIRAFDPKVKATIIEEMKKEVRLYLEEEIFKDLNDSKHLSYPVIWIISRFIAKAEELEIEKSELNGFLNTFIFEPCIKIMNKIMMSSEQNLPEEFHKLSKAIPDFIISPFSQKYFTKLVNDFKEKKNQSMGTFQALCSPKSDSLRFMYDIFVELSESTKEIQSAFDCLKDYNFDFTLNVIKEEVKYLSENGNEKITMPISIKDLVQLQHDFEQIERDLEKGDPLKSLLNEIKDFSDDKIDSTSPINNIVVNISFSPFFFYYKMDPNECEMIKCNKCLLPIPSIFLTEEEKEICKKGPVWRCTACHTEMSGANRSMIECKNCGKLKEKFQLVDDSFIFKRFSIYNEDELANALEKVFLLLPPLYVTDDISKECVAEINRIREKKDKSKEEGKLKILDDFRKLLLHEKEIKQESEKSIIRTARAIVEENINNRTKHVDYLKTVEDSITFINEYNEEAKLNYQVFENNINNFRKNIQRGYTSKFFAGFNKIVPIILKEKKKMKKKISKKFLVRDLIEKNVIHSMSYDNPKLVQKSYIDFERTADGLLIKLSYQEETGGLGVCNSTKHDFKLDQISVSNDKILDLRHISQHNQVIQLGDISFNTFYLDKLMNSLLIE